MSSEAILDFAALQKPIPGAAPAGIDLRQDVTPNSPYFRLKTARSQATAAERAGAADASAATPTAALWRTISDLSIEVLSGKSKDLQVCAWLIESLARAKGFAGLRDGFRLARELCEKFWDGLHPVPDEDGVSTRVAPIGGLNGEDSEGTLIAPIARIPITGGGDAAFAAWHWQKIAAPFQGNSSDPAFVAKKTQYDAANAALRGKLEAAVRQAPPGFYVELVADLTAAIDEFEKLTKLLGQKCGADAPPSSSLSSALRSVLDTVRVVAKEQLPAAAAPPDKAGEAKSPSGGPAKAEAGTGAINTRADALATLKKVADFFRRTEPHSPISYVVENAIRWGGLTLPEMLAELIPDAAQRDALFKRTGIRPPTQTTP